MTVRTRFLVRAALLALSLESAPAALAAEDAPYPIWWSPELGLESLQQIVWKLEEEFPRENWYEVVTYDLQRVYTDSLIDESHPEWGYNWNTVPINIERQTISDCKSLITWRDQGFNTEFESPFWYHANDLDAFYSGYCYALSALNSAKPAKQSFLRGFVFDENALSYVPPMIGMGWDSKGLYEFLQANRDRVSWKDFDFGWFEDQRPHYNVTVKDENTISVVNILPAEGGYPAFIASAVIITIYGRGDFDGDGLDDLLIRSEDTETSMDDDPKRLSSALYVVTRKEADSVLRVVDYIGPPPNGIASRHSSRNSIIESGQDQ